MKIIIVFRPFISMIIIIFSFTIVRAIGTCNLNSISSEIKTIWAPFHLIVDPLNIIDMVFMVFLFDVIDSPLMMCE